MFEFFIPKKILLIGLIVVLVGLGYLAIQNGLINLPSQGLSSQQILTKAGQEFNNGDAKTSLPSLEALVAREPTNRAALIQLNLAYIAIATNATGSSEDQQILKRMRVLAEKMLKTNDKDPQAYRLAASYDFGRGDFGRAAKVYQKSYDLLKENPKASNYDKAVSLFELGRAWQFVPDLTKTESFYREAAPYNSMATLGLGQILFLKGKFDETDKIIDSLLKQSIPLSAKVIALQIKAQIFMDNRHDYISAKETLEKALVLKPKNYKTLMTLAYVEIFSPKQKYDKPALDRTEKYLKDAETLNPYAADVAYYLGLIYQIEGRKSEAFQQYMKAKNLINYDRAITPPNKSILIINIENGLKKTTSTSLRLNLFAKTLTFLTKPINIVLAQDCADCLTPDYSGGEYGGGEYGGGEYGGGEYGGGEYGGGEPTTGGGTTGTEPTTVTVNVPGTDQTVTGRTGGGFYTGPCLNGDPNTISSNDPNVQCSAGCKDISYKAGEKTYGGGEKTYGGGEKTYGGGEITYGGGEKTYGGGEITYGGGEPGYRGGERYGATEYGGSESKYGGGEGYRSGESYRGGETYRGGEKTYGGGEVINRFCTDFSAHASAISSGQSSNLNWTCNTGGCSLRVIKEGSNSVNRIIATGLSSSGTYRVSPTTTTTYRLNCGGPNYDVIVNVFGVQLQEQNPSLFEIFMKIFGVLKPTSFLSTQ